MDWGIITLFSGIGFTIGLSFLLTYIFPDDEEIEKRRQRDFEKQMKRLRNKQ